MTVVRRITSADWPAWREIRLRSVQESPEAFIARVRTISAPDDQEDRWRSRIDRACACFIAFDDDRPVGMVALDPLPDGRRQLASMFVGAEARRRGIGTELIDAVVQIAGSRPLCLRVMDGNDAAIAAYQRSGFVLDGYAPDADGCLSMAYTETDEEGNE